MFKKTSEYLRGALEELHHVRWPTRQQAVRLSLIVIVFVFCTSVMFGVLDFALSRVVSLLLSLT
ncbi:MAG: preprotein translocase subunit SecE [Candidatus Peregrinibacteria bacterium]